MNNVDLILKWIREVDVKTLPYNVISVGWGPKTTNGERTGEYGIIFTVESKKDISQLNLHQIIPSTFTVSVHDPVNETLANIQTITDVQEPVLCQTLISYCHQNSNTVDPVKQHRVRRRTLMGGVESIGGFWGTSVGTLGLFVRDKEDGQIVALSNNHVFGGSQVSSEFKLPNDTGSTVTLNISGYQPSGYWKTTPENDYIGMCKRVVVIGDESSDLINYFGIEAIEETSCDAAILALKDYTLIDSLSSPNVLNFVANAPYKFATDLEIDSLAPGGSNSGAPIFRSGRTSGPIGYPGNTYSCNLSVYQLNWALVGNYSGLKSWFSDCFYVEGDVSPGAGGDSGSALFAYFSATSEWKVIGLLFAGPANNSYTIGCRITTIADKLNIGPWDTTIPTLSSKPTVIALEEQFTQTIELSGRTFYQVGYVPFYQPVL